MLFRSLFVNSRYAEDVETNLNDLEREIGKLEVEINRIQYYYENIENDVLMEDTTQRLLQNSKGIL